MHESKQLSYIDFVFAVRDATFAKRAHGDTLSDVERAVGCIWPFIAEVENGSIDQFLFNDAGDTFPETVVALEQIGCKRAAAALQAFAKALFGSRIPRTRAERAGYLESLPASVRFSPQLDALKEQVLEEDLRAAELAFIVAHQEFLPVPDGPGWTVVSGKRAVEKER